MPIDCHLGINIWFGAVTQLPTSIVYWLILVVCLQAMPQLTDRSKLPNIVDPVLQNKMDLKHLYQVSHSSEFELSVRRFISVLTKMNNMEQVAAVAVLCVQQEPSYRPLITDVLHSLIPLVPTELGGMLRVAEPTPITNQKSLSKWSISLDGLIDWMWQTRKKQQLLYDGFLVLPMYVRLIKGKNVSILLTYFRW